MRISLTVLGILVALAAMVAPAEAREYPWCATYRSGSRNCGFATHEQCMKALSGVGGVCTHNSHYRSGR